MNLTPTQKADELIEKFERQTNSTVKDWTAIKCAIIAVDEIISFFTNSLNWDYRTNGNIHFWQEVKQILTDRL